MKTKTETLTPWKATAPGSGRPSLSPVLKSRLVEVGLGLPQKQSGRLLAQRVTTGFGLGSALSGVVGAKTGHASLATGVNVAGQFVHGAPQPDDVLHRYRSAGLEPRVRDMPSALTAPFVPSSSLKAKLAEAATAVGSPQSNPRIFDATTAVVSRDGSRSLMPAGSAPTFTTKRTTGPATRLPKLGELTLVPTKTQGIGTLTSPGPFMNPFVQEPSPFDAVDLGQDAGTTLPGSKEIVPIIGLPGHQTFKPSAFGTGSLVGIRTRPSLPDRSVAPNAAFPGYPGHFQPAGPLVQLVPATKMPSGAPATVAFRDIYEHPSSGVSLGRIDIKATHRIEFLKLFGIPSGVAIVEVGTFPEQPLDRTGWDAKGPATVYTELLGDDDAVAPEALTVAVEQTRSHWMPSEEVEHRYEAEIVPYLVVEPAQAAGDGADSRESAQFDFAPTNRTWWKSHFCRKSSNIDPDSLWCEVSEGRIQTATRRVMFYEVAGMSPLGGKGGDLYVEYFDPNTSRWSTLFETGVVAGQWVVFTWQGEAVLRARMVGRAQTAIHFAERYRRSPTYFDWAGRYPFDQAGFGTDIQGVDHDAHYWYFSRTQYEGIAGHLGPFSTQEAGPQYGELVKVHVSKDLRDENQYKPRFVLPESWTREAGWNHYGDIAFVNPYLYVSLEGKNAIDRQQGTRGGVGIFDQTLKPIGHAILDARHGCGWIAHNPRNHRFYVKGSSAKDGMLSRYRITVLGNQVEVEEDGPELELSLPLDLGQNGKFSPRGVLWTVASRISPDGNFLDTFSLYAVDVNNGFAYYRGRITFDSVDDYWETEGITVWDLTKGQSPNVDGHLHIQFIHNNFIEKDKYGFVHLRALRPEAV